jgi:hypothetical protein
MVNVLELIIKLLPLVPIVLIGGGIILLLNNKEYVYKELKKWWKNRNEKQAD